MNATDINPSFLVYKASAGSGKTYNLAKSYLSICFANFKYDKYIYRKILGITFTNKAVYEMKTRILHFLKVVADGSDTELIQSFISEGENEGSIKAQAEKILNLIHHDYSNFSIFTIDTFFQQILRTFSYDLGLPAMHTLELDIDILTKRAVDIVLGKLGKDEALTNIIVQYAYKHIDEGKNWRIENQLKEIAKVIFKDTSFDVLKKIKNIKAENYHEIIKQLKSTLLLIDNKMKAIAKKAVDAMQSHGIDSNNFFQANKGIGKWFYTIANEGIKDFNINKYVTRTIEEDRWTAQTANENIKKNINIIAPILKECFYEIEEYVKKHYTKYQISKAIYDNIYPMATILEIKNAIDQIKTEDNMLHISESNHIIAQIVAKESIPFIYERLGNKYKYFFIDEFQDTSILQWQNLLPLVCDSLSSEVYQEKTGITTVFGDAKQAIYRFREGDVRQFNRLPKIAESDSNALLKEREEILVNNYKLLTLNNNFRSKQEIVEFNNAYFTYIYDADIVPYISDAYKDLKQSWKENNKGGAVCLSVINNEEITYFEAIAEEVFAIIEEALNDNYSLSDIAILCRTKDLASFLTEKIITTTHYKVITPDSLLLNQSPIVSFLIACLTYIANPNNQIAAAVIVQYVANENNIDLEEVLPFAKNKIELLKFIKANKYDFNLYKLKYFNTYETVEHLISIFNLKEKNDPFLMAFKGVVYDYMQMNNTTSIDFIEFWNERNTSFMLSNPEGIDAIKIMTIHKSKGLQFPIVIYPKKRSRNTSNTAQWINLDKKDYPLDFAYIPISKRLIGTDYAHLFEEEKNLSSLDEINLDYVVFTRPEERLYILFNTLEDKWLLSDFIKYKNMDNQSDNPKVERYIYGNFTKKTTLIHEVNNNENHVLNYPIKDEIFSPPIVSNQKFNSKEIQWGEIIHDYLSYILLPASLPYVQKRIKEDVNLTENEKDILLKISNYFLEDSYKSLFFGEDKASVKTEVEIIDANAKVFRIDRLIINENNYTIIDFKTGSKENAHIQQLNNYARLLKEIDNRKIYAYLVYINRVGELFVVKV